MNKRNLPKGCGSCHKGHGMLNTPMLPEAPETFCFRCHGSLGATDESKDRGFLSRDIEMPDIQKEFNKPYRHPIEKTVSRSRSEVIPETNRSAERHAGCVDCHHHHYASNEKKNAGVKGINSMGMAVQKIDYEYELCFKCHSYSANLPVDQKNKAEQFKTSNSSYHPVTGQGKNTDVPSLVFPLTAVSLIKCTDCHNNDDPTGPKGPHASSYRHILKKYYSTADGTEGPYQYELCYSCHRRESILANESFVYHDYHISVVGASCRTCHTPHGSALNTHLIEFDGLTVTLSSKGFIEFRDLGKRSGECYLTCHGKDHAPMSYPTNKNSLTVSPTRSLR